MEAFTLLKYLHTGGGTTALFAGDSAFFARATAKTIVTPASPYPGAGEDGPYFDLEFTIAGDAENNETPEKIEIGSGSGAADELSKNEKAEKIEAVSDDKLFAVEFEVDEEEIKGPLFSLFARDNKNNTSSVANHGGGLKHKIQDSDANWVSDERILTKEVMQKYLRMLKPLCIRVSSRYFEKMKFFGQVSFPGGGGGGYSPPCTAVASNLRTYLKQAGNNNNINLQAGLKVVRKHLGKSRSTSATVAAALPPGEMAGSNRRYDSLLQLEDGIQGAILHCKRSFNVFRDGESATLSRSVSDPSHEKAGMPPFSSAPTPLYYGEAKQTKI